MTIALPFRNITVLPSSLRLENTLQSIAARPNSTQSLQTEVLRNSHLVPSVTVSCNRSCVPTASWSAWWSSVDSYITSLASKGLLSRTTVTATNVLTSFGYLNRVTSTADVATETLTSWPSLTENPPSCSTGDDGCGRCVVMAESVQLLYWPISTYPGNPNSTISATTSETVSIVSNGTTFMSPSVYLSFPAVWEQRPDCEHSSRFHSNVLLTIEPQSLSSILGVGPRYDGYNACSPNLMYSLAPFDYADLNEPYLKGVSMNQSNERISCKSSNEAENCLQTEYSPIISIPQAILDIDPVWKRCVPYIYGAQDPPRALVPADRLSGPISTTHPTLSFPPTPIPTPAAPLATVKPDPSLDTTFKPTPLFELPARSSPSHMQSLQGPSENDPTSTPTTPEVESLQPPAGSSLAPIATLEKSSANNPTTLGSTPKIVSTIEPTEFTTKAESGLERSSSFVVNSDSSITSSGAITIAGAPISVASPPAFTIHAHTIPLSLIIALPHLKIGAQTFSPDPTGAYKMGGQILTPGGAVTLSGTSISLAPSATALIVSSTTTPLIALTVLPAITVGSQTINADDSGAYHIMGQTLSPGERVTVSGTPISLAPSATALVVDSVITPLTRALPLLTIGSSTFTADSSGEYQIMDQTLTLGGIVTISGTSISLASSATAVVIGSSTEVMAPVSTAPGIDELIKPAFDRSGWFDVPNGNNSTIAGNASHSDATFTGEGGRRYRVDWWAVILIMSLCYVL